jgi:hypothetical protein
VPPIPIADNFLASSLLTILMPTLLLTAIAIWYVLAVKRVPEDTPTSSTSLPPPEVVAAASEIDGTQTEPPPDQP